MFRLPRSLGPQIAPTSARYRLRGGRAVYTTQPPGWLPAPGRGIASHPTRATDAAGLSPAELQPCRLLPNPVTPTIDFTSVFHQKWIKIRHLVPGKTFFGPVLVPLSTLVKRVSSRLSQCDARRPPSFANTQGAFIGAQKYS